MNLIEDDLWFPEEDENLADRAEALSNEFAALESISEGSAKQKRWASNIFANNACDYYARRVLDGFLSQGDAEAQLRNPSAKWWIDNREMF